VAGRQDLQILEMLISLWQEMAQRARDRAERADQEPTGPSADYWYGIAFALELAATQLLTSTISMFRPEGLDSEAEPTDDLQTKLLEHMHNLYGLPIEAEALSQEGPMEPRARRLLNTIRSQSGQWLKRADIAHLLGNKTLSSGDMVLLQSLAAQGYIEARQVETNAPSGSRWEYRVH
jgi:hypothetical protein